MGGEGWRRSSISARSDESDEIQIALDDSTNPFSHRLIHRHDFSAHLQSRYTFDEFVIDRSGSIACVGRAARSAERIVLRFDR